MLGEAEHAFIMTGRGPEQQSHGVDNVLGVHQPGAGARQGGQALLRLGHVHRPGQRPGRARARPEGRPAAGLPARSPIPTHRAARRRGLGRRIPRACRRPGPPAIELLARCGGESRARLLVLGCQPAGVRAGRRAAAGAARGARPAGGVRTRSCPRPPPSPTSCCPTTQWAEEEGTMTNLEGRILLRRQMVAPPPGRAHRRRDRQGARRPARPRRTSSPPSRGRSSRSCAGPARAAWPTMPASPGSGSRPRTACSGRARTRAIRARRARSSTGSPPRAAARGSIAVEHRATAEEPDADYPLILTTGRVMAQYQSGTQTRRVAVAERGRARRRSARSTPTWRATLGIAAGRHGAADLAARARAVVRARLDAHDPARYRVRAVPLGRRGLRQHADQHATPTRFRGIPEFKVCAVHVGAAPTRRPRRPRRPADVAA